MSALLEAVGAGEFKKLRALGLDGFAVEIAAEDIRSKDWIMALSIDGKPLSIGDQGPIWLMHTPKSGGQVGEHEEQSWPWAVFYLHIE